MGWLPMFFKLIFRKASPNAKHASRTPRRSLRLESLENRQMLSIAPTAFVSTNPLAAVSAVESPIIEPAMIASTESAVTAAATGLNDGVSYTLTPSADLVISTATHEAVPQTPTQLLVSPQSSTMIVVSWDAAQDASYYRLEYRVDALSDGSGSGTGDAGTGETGEGGDLDWISLGNTVEGYAGKLVSKTLYVHQSLLPSTRYTYRLTAVNELGESSSVIESAATTPRVLATPEDFRADALSSSSVQLTWSTTPNADHYRLEYAVTGTDRWTTLSSMLTRTTYVQSGLSSNTCYVYRATACNLLEESESATTSATTLVGTLATPQYFTATAQNATTILLTWLSAEPVDGYRLEYSLGGQNQWQSLGGTFSSSTIFLHIRLAPNTVYDYRLVAYLGMDSSNPVAASAKTLDTVPAAPIGFAVDQATTDSLQLVWNAVGNTDYYRLEYRATPRVGEADEPWTVLDAHLTTTTFTHTGLSVDTGYTYRLTAVNKMGNSPSVLLDARTQMYPPTTPRGLTSELADEGEVRLSWNTATDATRWRLEYALSAQSDEWILLSDSLTTPEYLHTNLLSNTTYYWRLTAWNAGGSSGAVVVSRTMPQTLPKAPIGFVAVTQGKDSIHLSWDSTFGANVYRLEWSVTGSLWFEVGTLNTTEYTHTGLSEETTYYYRVSAINSLGASGYDYTQGTTSSALLLAPTQLRATVVKSSEIRLAWNAVDGATSYRLEYSTDGQTWTVGDAHLTTTGYIHSGLSAQTQYYYRVAAQNVTQRSNNATLTAQTTNDLLASPTAFSVVPLEGLNSRLSWAAVDNATGYQVEYSLSGTEWTALSGSALTSTGYLHLNITANTLYCYRVRSVRNDEVSAWSTASIRILVALEAPAYVETTTLSSTSLELQWTAVTKATHYLVEWSSNGGSTWQTLGKYATNTVIHQNLSPETTYQYRVTAQNNLYASRSVSCSGTTDAEAPVPPASPTGLAASLSSFDANDEISATFSWSAVPDATGYHLYESTAGGAWSLVFATEASLTTFVRTGLAADTKYDYQLFAINANGTSVPASLTIQTPKLVQVLIPEVPCDFTSAWWSTETVQFRWTSVANATGYRVESSQDGVHWSRLVDISGGAIGSYLAAYESSSTRYRIASLYLDASSATVATAWSEIAMLAPKAPEAPQMIRTSSSATRIQLSWSKVSADSCQLFRSVNGGAYQLVETLSNTRTSYTDTALSAGNEYRYQICAANQVDGQWIRSAFSTASESATVVVSLKSPSGVKILANSDGSSTISWSADTTSLQAATESVSNGSGFQYVLTRTIGGVSQEIALPVERLTPVYNNRGSQTGWSYTDTGLDFAATGFPANAVISYNLRAETLFVSTASLGRALTVTTAPEAAKELQVVTVGEKSVTLSWTAPPSGAAAYQVQRLAYNADGTPALKNGVPAWTTLRTVSGTEYTDKSVKTGAYYAYRVVSYNSKARLASAPTDSVRLLTTAAKAGSFKTVKNGVTSDSVTLSCTISAAVSGATYQFQLLRDSGDGVYREVPGVTWSLDTSGRSWVATGCDTTVSGGETYRYQVRVAMVSSELSQPSVWSPVSSTVRVKTST